MTEHDEQRCEDLLLTRRLLSLLCLTANAIVLAALVAGVVRLTMTAGMAAWLFAIGMVLCDVRIVRLQGRDRRRARA